MFTCYSWLLFSSSHIRILIGCELLITISTSSNLCSKVILSYFSASGRKPFSLQISISLGVSLACLQWERPLGSFYGIVNENDRFFKGMLVTELRIQDHLGDKPAIVCGDKYQPPWRWSMLTWWRLCIISIWYWTLSKSASPSVCWGKVSSR